MHRLLHLQAVFGLVLLTTGTAGAAPAANGTPLEPATPLFHGHWCGLGDENRASPVDALDAACRAHDLCYERMGRGACSCDKAFLKATARLVASHRMDETLRSKAATANSLFSAAPCVEPRKNRASTARR
jgi:hypothetical protein